MQNNFVISIIMAAEKDSFAFAKILWLFSSEKLLQTPSWNLQEVTIFLLDNCLKTCSLSLLGGQRRMEGSCPALLS